MYSRHTLSTRQTAFSFALIAIFALRAMVPAGFMPAPLSSGAPIALCPTGMHPSEIAIFFADQQQHHHHHHNDNADNSNDDVTGEFSCPIGLTLTALYLIDIPKIEFASLVSFQPILVNQRAYQSQYFHNYTARAPPIFT